MNPNETPEENPDVTQIPVVVDDVPAPEPVTEPVEPVPAEEPAPEVPVEPETPVDESPASDPEPNVVGTPTSLPQLDTVDPPQEAAPLPVPATAAPSQDAVTVNSHLANVQTQLQGVVDYCKEWIPTHPVAETVVADIETLVNTVKQALTQ